MDANELKEMSKFLNCSVDDLKKVLDDTPPEKKETRIKKWNTGTDIGDILSHYKIPSGLFYNAIMDGKITAYGQDGQEIIAPPRLCKFSQKAPPGFQYEQITYRNHTDFRYRGEDITKFLENIHPPTDQRIVAPPPAPLNGNTIIRKAYALTHANIVKRAYPNFTAKEAAQEINARLKEENLMGYSEKHLMKIIKPLGFSLGKSGRPHK